MEQEQNRILKIKLNGSNYIVGEDTELLRNVVYTMANDIQTIDDNISSINNELVETSNKLIDDEKVISETVNAIVESTGILTNENKIWYNIVENANYISAATSIHEATLILDENIHNVRKLASSSNDGLMSTSMYNRLYNSEISSNKIQEIKETSSDKQYPSAKAVYTHVKVLKDEVIANEETIANTFYKFASGSGLINAEGEIGYNQHSTANYISSATSIDEATVLLDSAIKGVENGYVKTDSDASLKSIQLSDSTNTSKVYTMTEGGVSTTYFENMNNGRLYLTGSDDSLGQIILDAKNIHPWSTGGFGNMGTASNPWAYTYSNNVYTDRLASKNGTLWINGLINNGNPNNGGTIDNVYFKANNICPGSKDPSNNLGTISFPWKTLNTIEATIGKANGVYGQNTITKGVLKFQNSTNNNTILQPSATSGVTIELPSSSGTIALTSQIPSIPSTIENANKLRINEATIDGYYPLTMVESSGGLPKYESLFTKTNIKYNPVQNILETGRVHAHTYTYSEHPENASLVVYNSLDSGSQESIYTSMRPRVGFVYYDNHVDDRYCGQIVMDKDGYTLYRGASDNSKNPDGTWKGTNDSVYKASNGGTPYAELRCGEIKAYVNDVWRNVISELDAKVSDVKVNGSSVVSNGVATISIPTNTQSISYKTTDIEGHKASTLYYPNTKGVADYISNKLTSYSDVNLSNISSQGEEKIKEVVSTVIPTEWYGTQEEFDALTEYQEGVNYYIYD